MTEAWWRRSSTFASYRYGPGSTPGCVWDVFHPSQPMPCGFPLGVFFHPQKGSKLFHLELVLGDVKSMALPLQPKREQNGRRATLFVIADRKLAPTLPLKYSRQRNQGMKYPPLTKETFYLLLIVNSKTTRKRCCHLSWQKSKSSIRIQIYNIIDFRICIPRYYTTGTALPLTPIVQINSLIVPKSVFIVWRKVDKELNVLPSATVVARR